MSLKSLMSDNDDYLITQLGNLGLIASAVSCLQWAPVMPPRERADAICNAGIKPYNILRLFDVSIPESQVEASDGQYGSCNIAIGSDRDLSPLAFSVASTASRGG